MRLKKYLKNTGRAIKIGALAGLSAFLINCQNPIEPLPESPQEPPQEQYEDYNIGGVYGTNIKDNLERPSGLSMYQQHNLRKSTEQVALNINSVFTTGPIYKFGEDRIILSESTNPRIYQISGNLEDILRGNTDIDILAEFPLQDYFSHFFTRVTHGSGPIGLERPIGLDLETVRLNDGNILFSSNISNKLFLIDTLGQISEYLQSSELRGITDMINGSDGKIWAVQQPIIEYSDSTSFGEVLRSKRIISIDSLKNINTEFEIPSDVYGKNGYRIRDIFDGQGILLFDEQLSLDKNSPIGKTRFGYDFYVADALAQKIYGVLGGVPEVLIDNVRFPTSLRVGLLGNLFYTTTPLWRGEDDYIDYPTELHFYRPATGEDFLIHKFDERNTYEYASSGTYQEVEYNGQTYVLPTGFNVSSALDDSDTNLRFLFTNSHQGILKGLTATKQ